MKLRLTHPWISGSLVAFFIACTLLAIFAEGTTLETPGFILLGLSMLILLFVYFPLVILQLFQEKIPNKDKVVSNIGIFGISCVVSGLVMKLAQFTGANVLVILGCSLLYQSYLPAWYASKFRASERLQRILYFIFCTCLGVLVLTFQFRIMHWPGATMMQKVLNYVFLFCFCPVALYVLLFKRDKNFFSVDSRFLFGFIVAFIACWMLSNKLTKNAIARNNRGYVNVENSLKLFEQKNKFLYVALQNEKKGDENHVQFTKLALELKEKANSTVSYITRLKAFLVNQTDNTKIEPDSVKFDNIRDKSNNQIPTLMLIGEDDEHPKEGPNTARELKLVLQAFVAKIDSLAPEENRLELKQSNPFNFDEVLWEDGRKMNWESAKFGYESLGGSFTTLTGFQANVRFMEMSLLNILFTKANANNKANMATQLADLAMKYETAKNEKKIALLEKDQAVYDLKMEAKDVEISNREQTIVYFIFALIAFGILTVFVIRSNILRKEANRVLSEQKEIISQQKSEVESQKHLIEEKQKEILDSISYAKRLQEAILPPQDFVNKYSPHNFILYKPKDIVAGDFYWAENLGDRFFIAAADSTGHGVPGCMVSVVCSNALNRSVKEFQMNETGKILDKTRELVLETFEKSTSEVKDGMDISLFGIDRKNKKLYWSGANNPLWYVENGKLMEITADKQPIGKTENPQPFNTHSIEFVEGSVFYLFTDGLADQFGGPKGKKFKYKQFSELVLSIADKPMAEQSKAIDKAFEDWKRDLEQVDDVCVIGIRI